MRLNETKFGIAWAISASVFWIICSALVWAMPNMMISMSGDMLHMQLQGMGWHLSLAGVLLGLVAWVAVAGLFGWLLALVYNRL
ncbi:DUF5676 family membrane protein [Simiduia agarivorans]|uniref:Uncharacterized protein n=1 Tax=Simiduia agarivorans (strain DSM 21679 / JCM 13881 / BCRC 17597 / SA1) TaxID=1117647 RepID=K4KFR8_SIMAS|nr:DUF5676 family membrane protein [Simiduia agarivorans]AFU97786.1 hypothetical protein M5M_02855 [Simiduia agarivorans SA1 = DSM 21679]